MSLISITKNLGCEVNLPKRLKGESLHSLPPYAQLPAFCVDDYPGSPDSWMRGSAREGSYFVGVKAGHGLWLDFNSCWQHTHDVAVLISIQGINPVTGKPLAGVKMAQHHDECPVHGAAFQGGRFCPECGYKWPAQNYLSTTGTQWGALWLDGFRGADGEVRQYVFTEETARGVAAQVLGDARVFAIGVSFFLSKTAKPLPTYSPILRSKSIMGGYQSSHFPPMYSSGSGGSGAVLCSCASIKPGDGQADYAFHDSAIGVVNDEPTQLEIAAGARISQEVGDDPKALDYWEDKPASTLYINYLPEKEVEAILSAGKRATKADGALSGLLVGSN